MASPGSDIVSKAEAILASARAFKGERVERYALMKQIDLLYLELEDPMDASVELGFFEEMPKQGSSTATELAKLVKLEPTVLVRLMRMLTATRIVTLTREDEYAHTPKSLAYLNGAAVDFYNLCMNMFGCFLTCLLSKFTPLFYQPEYFKTKTPEDLIDLGKTAYTYAYGKEGQTFYEVVAADPDRMNMFNKAMMQQEANLPVLGMFPFSSLRLEIEAELDRAFVVDIAGGRGQCLLLIQKETSNGVNTPSKMILQDRPQVLDTIPQELVPGIEKMPYDFYTEQPIKNAHVYYLRRILHNYQDNVCQKMLTRIAEAMTSKSRLLIAEAIVPAKTELGEDMSTYWMDMVMR